MDISIFRLNIRRMNKLAARLKQAMEQLDRLMPLEPADFDPEQLDPGESLFLDGFRARFSDLQDMLGRTIFKSIAWMDEDELPGSELTTRERIALMEKRGLIDADRWKDLREVRNRFAHEYPDQHQEKAVNLNAAWEYAPELLETARKVTRYARERHGLEDGGLDAS